MSDLVKQFKKRNRFSAGDMTATLYSTFPKHELVGKPNYNNHISEEEADRLGYFPDERGHRSDKVKLPNHPTHPSRGTFVGNEFRLSDIGMEDPNFTIFGLVDNGDGYAIPTYNGSVVLPEITVTPKGNYYMNTYDKIKLSKFKGGGKTHFFVKDDKLYRKNSDGTETLFPFIKGSTYDKYKSSEEFMKTLELAFNRYGQRVDNEREQLIKLSGKTKPVTIKDRGTYQIPIEIFDRIINSSKAAGINPKLGLAIAIKESSGYTDPKRVGIYYGGNLGNSTWKAFKSQDHAGPSTIVSNWQYFSNSPYIGLLKGWENSDWDAERVSEDAKYLYKKHKDIYDNYDKNLDEDILTNMFRYL